jgi:hypothetical protein
MVNLGRIPAAMRTERRWVCWEKEIRDGSPTKVPISPLRMSGNRPSRARSNDPSTWGTFEEACALMANYPEDDYGLGFMLGEGWCGLDLDHIAKDTQEIDADAFVILADLEGCGYAEWSPSGDGVHVIFWTDKPKGYTSRRSLNDDAHAEFYGSGRFFTVTGNCEGFEHFDVSKSSEDAVIRLAERLFKKGPTSAPTEFVAPPKRFEGMSAAETYAQSIIARGVIPEGQRNSRLFQIAGHISKKCNYDFDETLRLTRLVNSSCLSPPLGDYEVVKCANNGINAGERRVDSESPYTVESWDEIRLASNFDIKKFASQDGKSQKMRIKWHNFEDLGGYIGEYVNFCRKNQPGYQPELAIAGALTSFSTILSGRVELNGLTPNIFAVSLAPSGAGKDFARSLSEKILRSAGLEKSIGPEHLSSGEGLVSALAQRSVLLMQLDEAAELIGEVGNGKNPIAQRTAKFLKEAYSKSGRPWQPNARADVEKNLEIQYPCPTIYMTTTPDRFWNSFPPESIEDGLLGRLLVFEGKYVMWERPDDYVRKEIKPCEKLIGYAKAWANSDSDLHGLVGFEPDNWTYSKGGLKSLNSFLREIDEKSVRNPDRSTALWKRCEDRIGKLSLLLAASVKGPDSDRLINSFFVDLAISTIKGITYRVYDKIQNELGTHEEAKCQIKILKILERHGPLKPGYLPQKGLQFPSKVYRAALHELHEQGKLLYCHSTGEYDLSTRKASIS